MAFIQHSKNNNGQAPEFYEYTEELAALKAIASPADYVVNTRIKVVELMLSRGKAAGQ